MKALARVLLPIAFYAVVAWLLQLGFSRLNPTLRLTVVIVGAILLLWFVTARLRHVMSPSAVAGLVATALTFALWQWEQSMPPLPPSSEISGFFTITALRFKLFHEGPVPVIILWVFVYGVASLVVTRDEILGRLKQAADQLREYMVGNRALGDVSYYGEIIERLNKRHAKDQDMAAVIALKDDLLALEEEKAAIAFVPTTWVEWTLPMLGFLGTVIGIGDAITEVSRAVFGLLSRGNAEIDPTIMAGFNRGFAGMAVAFDTTFLGLAGLIAVGTLRSWSKKAVADRLRLGKETITNYVEERLTGGEALTDGFVTVNVSLEDLAVRLERSMATLAARMDEHASTAGAIRDRVLEAVEQVVLEDESYASIRRVLLKRLITLEAGSAQLAQKTAKHLDSKLGEDWTCVAIATGDSDLCTAVLRASTETRPSDSVFWFKSDREREGEVFKSGLQLRQIWMVSAEALVAVTEPDGKLVELKKSDDTALSTRVLLENLTVNDHVIVASISGDPAVLVARNDAAGFSITEFGKTQHEIYRRDGCQMQLCTEQKGSLFIVSAATFGERQADLLWLRLVRDRQKNDTADSVEPGPEASAEKLRLSVEEVVLPDNMKIAGLAALSEATLILLDAGGEIHYWDASLSSPVRLAHNNWKPFPQTIIRPGSSSWISVVKQDSKLEMWRIGKGGFLTPYDVDHSIPVPTNSGSDWRVTGDGRWLLGHTEKIFLLYRFPAFAADRISLGPST